MPADCPIVDRCEEFAQIELEHIQLELKHGRYQHLRSFVDQYYCYRNRLIKTRSSFADWERVVWTGIVSVAAMAEQDRKCVVKDHAVPLKVISAQRRKLRDDAHPSVPALDEIADLPDRLTHFGTITKAEDKLLREKKLSSSMPGSFFEEAHPDFMDARCRYRAAGIQLVDGMVPARHASGSGT